jgi:hypothetical protein
MSKSQLFSPGDFLKLLRFEQRVGQIDKQRQSNDPAYDIFPIHGSTLKLEPIAGTYIPE